jgi:hypothetical protein
VAANETGQDLRQAGKLREARTKLSVCMAAACPGPVREDCGQRLDEIERAVPTVVFDVKDSAGRDLPYVKLSIDGKRAGLVEVTALPLDPGQHLFRFEAAGQPGVEREVVLREGEKQKRVFVVIGPASAPRPAEPSAIPDETRGDGRRMAGWITGGVGVATMGIGIVVALSAKSSWENAPNCIGTHCADNPGITATNSARSTGDIATAVFVIGAVAATTGVVLWLTAPRAQSAAATGPAWRVGLTLGGLSAEGRF